MNLLSETEHLKVDGWDVAFSRRVTKGADPTEINSLGIRRHELPIVIVMTEMFGDWQVSITGERSEDDVELKNSLDALVGVETPPTKPAIPPHMKPNLETTTGLSNEQVDDILKFYQAPSLDQMFNAYLKATDYSDDPMGPPSRYESMEDDAGRETAVERAALAKVEAELHKKYDPQGLTDLYTSFNSGAIKIHSLRVNPNSRSRGVGSAVLDELKKYAGERGVPIVLVPEPERGKKAALDRFYRRAGFHHNRGRRRDYRLSQMFAPTMVWKPSKDVKRLTDD